MHNCQLAVFKQHYFLLLFWRPLNIKYVQKVRIDVSNTKRTRVFPVGFILSFSPEVQHRRHYAKRQRKIDKNWLEVQRFPREQRSQTGEGSGGRRGSPVQGRPLTAVRAAISCHIHWYNSRYMPPIPRVHINMLWLSLITCINWLFVDTRSPA